MPHPLSLLASVRSNGHLIRRLATRNIQARFRGSLLGASWLLIAPLLLLAVYTLVFSTIFQARWSAGSAGDVHFALILYLGLAMFMFFAECMNRSAGLMRSHQSFIKQLNFPLDVLPVVLVVEALSTLVFNGVVLGVMYILFIGVPPISVIFIPAILVPLVFIATGIAFFMASLGVYILDLQQVTRIMVTMLLFLSGIFYPISALPDSLSFIAWCNPLMAIIEMARQALYFESMPHPVALALMIVGSWLFSWAGYAWFMKTRKGFADVI